MLLDLWFDYRAWKREPCSLHLTQMLAHWESLYLWSYCLIPICGWGNMWIGPWYDIALEISILSRSVKFISSKRSVIDICSEDMNIITGLSKSQPSHLLAGTTIFVGILAGGTIAQTHSSMTFLWEWWQGTWQYDKSCRLVILSCLWTLQYFYTTHLHYVIYTHRLVWYKVTFFKVFLSDIFTCPILGPLVPLFWISGDVFSGFQRQNPRIVEVNVMYISWDPPLVLHIADLLIDSIARHRPGSYLAQGYYCVAAVINRSWVLRANHSATHPGQRYNLTHFG